MRAMAATMAPVNEFSSKEYSGLPYKKETNEDSIKPEKTMKSKFSKRLGLYAAASSCLLASISTGLVLGYTAPVGPKMVMSNKRFRLSKDASTWFGSIVALGALAGALAGGPLGDTLGRKTSIILNGISFFAGWMFIAYGSSLVFLDIGRVMTGFGVGLTCAVAPTYIVEISTVDTRGFLGASFQVCMGIGVLLATLIGWKIHWTWLAAISTIPVILMMITMAFMPESPRWLMSRGRIKEAVSANIFLHGKGEASADEMVTMSDGNLESKESSQFSFSLMKERRFLLPTIYSIALMFFQQCCGINAVVFYTVDIFNSSGSTLDAVVATIITNSIGVIGTIVCSILMDKAGRRILLLASGAGISVSLLVLGVYYYCFEHQGEEFTQSYGWLGVVCLVSMVGSFALGFGPIPWMIISEMVPQRAKGVVGGVATAVNWASVFTITKTFQTMIDGIHADFTYWFYCAVSVAGCVFIYFCIPETKGKSLEEISQHFDKSPPDESETPREIYQRRKSLY